MNRLSGEKRALILKCFTEGLGVNATARMADVLAPQGYQPVEDPEQADLVILNTCHIREKAAEKVYSESAEGTQ